MGNKLIAIFIFLISILSSCTFVLNVPPERIYTDTEITYSEPFDKYGFRINMAQTETEFAEYFFESTIDDDEREACIKVTNTVLSGLESKDPVPEIYIFSQDRYRYKYIDGHKLYVSASDWTSVDYIADVLTAVFGGSAHYGTAWGYANYLAMDNKWKTDIDGKFSIPSDYAVLDLNCLCFDESHAASEDVIIAKEIACDFVESYIIQYGEKNIQKLLSSYSEALNMLSLYYADNGISYNPSALKYSYGGKTYDYLVYSDYGTFYISEDWVDMNAELNPLIGDGFLHSNYSEIKTFFEINTEQMRKYQELFDLDDYNNDLDIIFMKNISGSNSFYHGINHCIYLYNVDSLMHEYIHSLTLRDGTMSLWKIEGLARYFSYYYDHYGMAFLNQDYNNTPDTEITKYIQEYLNTIGRPIDMAKDFRELENIAVYSFGLTDPNRDYLTGSSFVQYLVKQYGEKVVVDHICGSGEPLPKTYRELVKDWNEYIETNYQGYSKYK